MDYGFFVSLFQIKIENTKNASANDFCKGIFHFGIKKGGISTALIVGS